MARKDNLSDFKKAYNDLNLEQKLAVDTIEGPVMVVAGPGTGKTQILTLRIANILLKTDVSPSNILALTFTESGAKTMRDRLRLYIGAVAYQVPIFTFHGFAQKLIGDYPDAYTRVIGGRPINDIAKIAVIESIINNVNIKLLRPSGDPSYYVSHIIRILSQLKQEYITPDTLSEIILKQESDLESIEKVHSKGAHKGKIRGEYTKKEKSLIKNKELLYIYRLYEATLNDSRLYDFDDMIVETIKALTQNEEMLRDLQETYQYVLADEHQDVNGSQNKILELLVSFHDSPNIFTVGDEKQAIYRFQGASLENFLQFTDIYKDAKVISLTQNYRSGRVILDVVHSLVEVTEGPLADLRIPLKAANKDLGPGEVNNLTFSHQAVEDDALVTSIKTQLDNKVPPREIAVILRTNREVEDISTLLRKHDIAVLASADGDVLEHPITREVFNLIDSVVEIKSELALFKILHASYWSIDRNDLFKILSSQNFTRNLLAIITSEEILTELKIKNRSSINKLVKVLSRARELESIESPHRVLEYLIKESGLLDGVMKHDPIEGSRVLRRLYDEVESMVSHDGLNSLTEISQSFKKRLEYGLSLKAPYISTNADSVQVMTAHKSKGLEFEVVYLPHLSDRNWSGLGKKKYFDIPLSLTALGADNELLEDARRLFYVALTRAKKRLFLSVSETNIKGDQLLPTRLLSDIDHKNITEVSTKTAEENFNPLGTLTSKYKESVFDKSLLKHFLSERGFSATSLNNYLKSPFNYLYRNVFRIPEIQPTHMQFGTVVHNVLEYITRSHSKNNVWLIPGEIKSKLEQELRKLPINNDEYYRLHEKSFEVLLVYLEHLKLTLPKETKEEMKLRVVLSTGLPDLPEVTLTGKLDRLDFDSNGRVSRIVDYKTGKPKSRNVIEGNTKDSDGDYKRQLVFYALLLQLYDEETYFCREGVLSFVEPDPRGNIKEEIFIVTEAEIEELKQTIIQSVKEISSGDFLNVACDPERSDYCRLARNLIN